MSKRQDIYGVIYKITNKINGKLYVGQTVQGARVRFLRHLLDARNGVDTVLCRAIRKYGEKNFNYQVIDVAYNYEELNQKEEFWITSLNTYVNFENSNGYNMKIGWQAMPYELNHAVKLDEETIKSIVKLSSSGKHTIDMLVDEFNISKSSLNELFNKGSDSYKRMQIYIPQNKIDVAAERLRSRGREVASEKISKKKSKENHHMWGKHGKNNPNSKAVLKIDKETNEVLEEYESVTEASKSLDGKKNTVVSKVSLVCRGERNTAYGFKWKYKNEYLREKAAI